MRERSGGVAGSHHDFVAATTIGASNLACSGPGLAAFVTTANRDR